MLWSMHAPHPSPHGLPMSSPGFLCSAHPGQAHSTPHVHPEPANEDISRMEGMEGKSGIESGRDENGENSIGARSGPGVRARICFRRLQKVVLVGVAGCEWSRSKLMILEDGPESASGGEYSKAAARASVARPSKGTEICALCTEEPAL